MGPIAQSVEQRTFNPWVDGSSPSGPTHKLSVFCKDYSLIFDEEASKKHNSFVSNNTSAADL